MGRRNTVNETVNFVTAGAPPASLGDMNFDGTRVRMNNGAAKSIAYTDDTLVPSTGIIYSESEANAILIAAGFSLLGFGNYQQWYTRTPFPLTGRHAGYGFGIGSFLYVGAGGHTMAYLQTGYKFNPTTNAWTAIANYPILASYLFSFTNGVKGYVGTGQNTGGYLNTVYEYDPGTNLWTAKDTFSGGTRTARAHTWGAWCGSYGYVGCGSDGVEKADCHRFDPAAAPGAQWTAVDSFTGVARLTQGSFSTTVKVYVMNGQTAGAPQVECYEFNPAAAPGAQWTLKAPYPGAGVWGAKVVYLRSKGVVFGGYLAGNITTAAVYEYDPVANTWAQREPLPVAITWGMVGVVGNLAFHVCGSTSSVPDTRVLTNYEYNPPLFAYVKA